MIGMIW